jgi:uncharacterized protein with HEPN domain
MLPDDRARILHILDACDAVQRFVANRRREDIDSDDQLLFALTRAIEIIGEAASRVSEPTRDTIKAIPWQRMTSMRNRLVHAYSTSTGMCFGERPSRMFLPLPGIFRSYESGRSDIDRSSHVRSR